MFAPPAAPPPAAPPVTVPVLITFPPPYEEAPPPEEVPPVVPAPPAEYYLSISVDGRGTVTPGSGSYPAGVPITLVASPSLYQEFDYWSGDVTGTIPTTAIRMDSDKSIVAHFRGIKAPPFTPIEPYEIPPVPPLPAETYRLYIDIEGEGKVIPPSGREYIAGSTVALVATPAPGYDFDRWGGDASGTSRAVTIKMDRGKSAVAYFKALEVPEPPVAPPVLPPKLPRVSQVKPTFESREATIGDVVRGKITWMPTIAGSPELFSFGISADLIDSRGNPVKNVLTLTPTVDIGALQEDEFKLDTTGLSEGWYGLQVKFSEAATGIEIAKPKFYNLLHLLPMEVPKPTVAPPPPEVPFEEAPPPEEVPPVSVVEEAPPERKYILWALSGPGGSAKLSTPYNVFIRGETVDVIATPNPGYRFDHWDLDGERFGTMNPLRNFMVTAPHTLTAYFRRI